MKKIFHMFVLFAELVLNFMVLSILWNSTLYIELVVIVILWLFLLLRLILKMKKENRAEIKQKFYRRLVLVMAVPMIIFIILVIGFIIKLSMVI